jgi:hypothetical protein
MFPCALGTFSVKRERVYGCFGYDLYDLYDLYDAKWSVYWCSDDELGWKYRGLEPRVYIRQSIRVRLFWCFWRGF